MGTFGGAQPIVTDGLVFAVDAANYESYPGSGTTWSDLVGSNNGTLINGPTFDSGNGGSIVFDGTNDYIDCGNPTELQLTGDTITTEHIFSCTENRNSIYYPCLLSRRTHWLANDTQYSVFLTNDGTNMDQRTGFFRAGSGAVTANTTLNDGNIHFLTCVYDGSTLKIYHNGELDCTPVSSTGNMNSIDTNVYIGVALANSSINYTYVSPSNIYLTRIYNRALSSTEITQNYNALKSRFGL